MHLTQKHHSRIFTNFNWFFSILGFMQLTQKYHSRSFTNFNWFRHPEAYAVNAETAMVGVSNEKFIDNTDFLFTPASPVLA